MERNTTARTILEYSDSEKADIADGKLELESQIGPMLRRGKYTDRPIHQGTALRILSALTDAEILFVMIIAFTQSGKTEMMLSLIRYYLKNNEIPIKNFYIITGLSSTDWKTQMFDRLPTVLKDRVYHRQDLNRFKKDVENQRNVVIILDEIQVAAEKGQSVGKAFAASIFKPNNMWERDVKLIEFSATPDGLKYSLGQWPSTAFRVILPVPGEGYTGCFDLLDQGRVKQFKDLSGFNSKTGETSAEALANIDELRIAVENMGTPLIHLIRAPGGAAGEAVTDNLKKVFGDVRTYDCSISSEINDIKELMNTRPVHNIIIVLKNMMRCAVTIPKKYLGILYERWTKSLSNDSTIIQGLLGRATGFDDNGFSIVYTNIPTIKLYKRHHEAEFSDDTIPWKSNTTKFDNTRGVTVSTKSTWNSPECCGIESTASPVAPIPVAPIPEHWVYTNWSEVKAVCKMLKYNCSDKKKSPDGFEMSSITNHCKIETFEYCLSMLHVAIPRQQPPPPARKKPTRTCFVGYIDKTDVSTVRYIVIIRPSTSQVVKDAALAAHPPLSQ
tara:strand:+ start:57 stop:1727 length:1671 start_codon:yes stop_codon:yes gene_type:complete